MPAGISDDGLDLDPYASPPLTPGARCGLFLGFYVPAHGRMVAVLTGFGGVTIQGSEHKSILVAPWLQCLSSEGLPCVYIRSNLR